MSGKIKKLIIDGKPSPNGKRFGIIVDEKRVYLTGQAFVCLIKLAWACKKYQGGCINRDQIASERGRPTQHVYRLRQQVEGIGLKITNDHTGRYWLKGVDHEAIEIKEQALREFPDAEIRRLVG